MTVPFTRTPTPDHATLERGRKLFAGPCDFVKGVVDLPGLPPEMRMEVCFAGRSNVGKSSLINALTGRKSLARASNTPGRTQEINFFDLGGSHYLVDLPGYGFAKAPPAKVEAWQRLLKAYLAGRSSLRRAFVLIDARHGVKSVDTQIMSALDSAAVNFQIVLTKIDKLKPNTLEPMFAQLAADLQRHPAAYPEFIATSSETGEGMADLRAIIAGLV